MRCIPGVHSHCCSWVRASSRFCRVTGGCHYDLRKKHTQPHQMSTGDKEHLTTLGNVPVKCESVSKTTGQAEAGGSGRTGTWAWVPILTLLLRTWAPLGQFFFFKALQASLCLFICEIIYTSWSECTVSAKGAHRVHTPSLGGIIAESLAVKSTDSGDLGSSPSSTTLQPCDSGQWLNLHALVSYEQTY